MLSIMRSAAPLRTALFSAVFFSAVSCLAAQQFYYIVLQWPGSYCSTKHGCCYPKSGKPSPDFTIAGLWPYNIDGRSLTYCNNQSRLDISKISDLSKSLNKEWPLLGCPRRESDILWSAQWLKYGTCSKTFQNQHRYFETALNLKKKINLLKVLQNAGIQPNGTFYDIGSIMDAVQQSFMYMPGLLLNKDKLGQHQLYRVIFCVDVGGSKIMDCPGVPNGNSFTVTKVKFPSF